MAKAGVNHPVTDAVWWQHAHAQLLRHSELQFQFPAMETPKPPAWLVALLNWLKPVGPYVVWALGIVLAALVLSLLYIFVRRAIVLWNGRAPRTERPEPDAAWRPAPEAARRLLRDADDLASGGDFGEAVHLLLLRSIDDIEERRPASVRPALTSREIGRLDALPSAARVSFEDIARVVERSLFGGRPVDAADYARCRDAYERFAFPESWSAPA